MSFLSTGKALICLFPDSSYSHQSIVLEVPSKRELEQSAKPLHQANYESLCMLNMLNILISNCQPKFGSLNFDGLLYK